MCALPTMLEKVMKFFRAIILATMLVLGVASITEVRSAWPEPKPVVEYNFGMCGGDIFTVSHAVLSTDEKGKQSLIFTYRLSDPQTVVKNEGNELISFAFKPEPKDKDGDQKFKGEAKLDGHVLVLNGLIRGDRVVAILMVDGELGHLLYGGVGKVDDMVKVADEDSAFCGMLHGISIDQLPKALASWLLEDKSKNLN
jgi:hypothetical protein